MNPGALAGVIVVVLQSAVIAALLVQRSRRRAYHKRAEESLDRVETTHSAILRVLPDLMFIINAAGIFVDYHARDENELFVPASVFLGRTVTDTLPPSLAEQMMAAIGVALSSPEPVVVDYELAIDGARRFYEARIVRCGTDRIVAIVRELTDSRRAHERNRVLAGRLISAQEAERRRLARELHDDLSQRAALVKIALDQVAGTLKQGTDVTVRLKEIADNAGELARDVSYLAHQLHPATLHNLGLEKAIRSLCAEVCKQHRVESSFTPHALPESIRDDVALCMYRVAQEALHNVVRHSGARRVAVELDGGDDTLALRLVDDGNGFDVSQSTGTGLGLVSMRERVTLLGGTLTLESAPGRGTELAATVPLTPPSA